MYYKLFEKFIINELKDMYRNKIELTVSGAN
jgi:hypothetical protein